MTYIKLFVDYLEALEPLGDAEKGRLFTALLEYARTGEAPQLCGNERFLFPMMRAQIDRDMAAFAEESAKTSQARREAGRKGGLAKAGNFKQNLANVANAGKSGKSKQSVANVAKDKDKDKDEEKDEEKDKDKKDRSDVAAAIAGRAKKFNQDDPAYQAALYLDKRMCSRLPGQKGAEERRLQTWALEFDRCHRLDGHSWEDIGRVLRFSQTDPFWQANILSGGKFREKYVQLLAKMRSGAPAPARETSYDIDEIEAMSSFDLPDEL